MGQQVAQRDRPAGRPQLRLARRIEAFQDLWRCQLGQQLAHGLLEVEPALLDQLHAGGRGHRLGHRGDPEHAVRRDVRAAVHVLPAKRALVDDALVGGAERDHMRHQLRIHRAAERVVDRRERAAGERRSGRRTAVRGAGNRRRRDHGRGGLQDVATTRLLQAHLFCLPRQSMARPLMICRRG